jgi:hypothetical protein
MWKRRRKRVFLEEGNRFDERVLGIYLSTKVVYHMSLAGTKKASMLHLIENLIQRNINHLFDQRQERLSRIKKAFVWGNISQVVAEKHDRKEIESGRHEGSRSIDTFGYSRLQCERQHLSAFAVFRYIEA